MCQRILYVPTMQVQLIFGRENTSILSVKAAKGLIAVYIDSLVMISIERSETNKKKSTGNPRQNFFKREIFFHNFLIKHDILRLFAKKKNFGENFPSPKYMCVDIYT